ncbi:MAG: hypothetical protein HYU77_08960 [Betaproteobacteria bacterium]|nr:hypothetical protein [Betaproteobacteria bacterium]
MARPLADSLRGGTQAARPLWIDSADYAIRLFLKDGAEAWADAHHSLWWIQQAQSLLKSDVIEIPMGAFMAHWLRRNPQAASPGHSAKRVARTLLGMEGPRAQLADLLNAVSRSYRGSPPLVLRVPTPCGWLALAAGHPGRTPECGPDEEEAVAVYLADCLRSFAECGLDGILIDAAGEPRRPAAELLDRCNPVMNLAGHYRWSLGLQVGDAVQGLQKLDGRVNFLLGPAKEMPAAPGSTVLGCRVPAELWHADAAAPVVPENVSFLFAPVPADAVPEKVLAIVSALRN